MDGARNTVQRQLILDAVRELDRHATAEQVYGLLVRRHPSISKATVYRNLGRMAESGELLNIGSLHGSARYDHNRHKHYHFVCDECRRVFDVDAYSQNINEDIPEMEGFSIKGHALTFHGTCRDCGAGAED